MKLKASVLIIGIFFVTACAQTTPVDTTAPSEEAAKFELGSTELTILLFGLAVLVTAVQ